MIPLPRIISVNTAFPILLRKAGEVMTEKELLQRNIEEFSRVQDWMLLSEKNSNSYKAMRKRYIELKIILMASGVNLNELDMIKE